jgi:hypothetical protein
VAKDKEISLEGSILEAWLKKIYYGRPHSMAFIH